MKSQSSDEQMNTKTHEKHMKTFSLDKKERQFKTIVIQFQVIKTH